MKFLLPFLFILMIACSDSEDLEELHINYHGLGYYHEVTNDDWDKQFKGRRPGKIEKFKIRIRRYPKYADDIPVEFNGSKIGEFETEYGDEVMEKEFWLGGEFYIDWNIKWTVHWNSDIRADVYIYLK